MTDTSPVPEGFELLPLNFGFIGHNGSLWGRRDDRGMLFGTRIEPHQCNPMMICHGGWLATLMDMVMPIGVRVTTDLKENFLLTVSLSLDYLGSAPVGSWVEGRCEILRRTSRMVFTQSVLRVGEEAVLRGSGVFRIGPSAPPLGF